MRKLLIPILLSLSLAAPVSARLTLEDSIRPLFAESLNEDTGEMARRIVCTTWATRVESRVLWVTAAHCVLGEDGKVWKDGSFLVGGAYADVVKVDGRVDLAMLSAETKARPLNIAFSDPSTLQTIYTAGHPFGSQYLHVVSGTAGREDDGGVRFHSLPVAPGMSGAPILDMKQDIVEGVVLQTECPSTMMGSTWCPVSRGESVRLLREFLGLD